MTIEFTVHKTRNGHELTDGEHAIVFATEWDAVVAAQMIANGALYTINYDRYR